MHRLPVPSVAVPGHIICPPYYPHPALEAPRSIVASSGQQSPGLSFHVAVSLPGYRLSIGAEAETASGSQVRLLPPERDVAAIISKKNPSLGCVASGLGWAEHEPLAPVLTRFAPCPVSLVAPYPLPSYFTSLPPQACFFTHSHTPHRFPQRLLPQGGDTEMVSRLQSGFCFPSL